MITSEKGRCIILIEKKSLSDLVLISPFCLLNHATINKYNMYIIRTLIAIYDIVSFYWVSTLERYFYFGPFLYQ